MKCAYKAPISQQNPSTSAPAASSRPSPHPNLTLVFLSCTKTPNKNRTHLLSYYYHPPQELKNPSLASFDLSLLFSPLLTSNPTTELDFKICKKYFFFFK
jgi:hypothetical protein